MTYEGVPKYPNQLILWNGTNFYDGYITNSNISPSVQLTGTSVNPTFGSQNISTSGTLTISSLSTGVVQSNSSGLFSSGPINLASGLYVSGVLPDAYQQAQTMSGDVTGSTSGAVVVALQGKPVQSGTLTSAQDGYVLTWHNAGPYWYASLVSGSNVNPNFGTQSVSTSGALSAGATTVTSLTNTGLGTGVVQSNSSGLFSSGPINLASSTYVSGTLGVSNLPNLAGDVTGTITSNTLASIDGYSLPNPGNHLGILNSTGSAIAWTALAGDISGTVGATTVNSISGSSPIVITPATLQWISSASSPTIQQATVASGSGASATGSAGNSLTIKAQAGQTETGTTSTGGAGGNLVLDSGTGGTGTSTNGTSGLVNLQTDGTLQLQLSQSSSSSNLGTTGVQISAGSSGNIYFGSAVTAPTIGQFPVSSSIGSSFNITAQASVNDDGGTLTITGGSSSYGDAGLLSILGGTGSTLGTSGNGGGITIMGGTTPSSGGNGGTITIIAGESGHNSGSAGSVNITAGAGQDSAGGNVTISSGFGTTVGSVSIQANGTTYLQVTSSGAAINGIAISTGAPSTGYVLTATSSSAASWQASSGGFTPGGDLSGSSTSQKVIGIDGYSITPLADGYLYYSGTSMSWQTIGSVSGSAGGDLGGTYPNPTLAKIDGYTLPTPAAPAIGVLQTSGTSLTWGTVNLASSSYVSGTLSTANQANQTMGGDISGTTASATVAKLDGYILPSPTPGVLEEVSGSLVWSTINLASSSYVSGVLPTANQANQSLTLTGDVTSSGGTTGSASTILAKIDGYTLPTPAAPAIGVLQTSGTALTWGTVNLASSSYVSGVLPTANQASQTMGGDVSGTTASATVIAIDGYQIANTPLSGYLGSAQDGYVLTYHNATGKLTFLASSSGGGGPTGSAGGDLSGTYPNPTVAHIQGNPVVSGALSSATDGYFFVANTSNQWASTKISGDITSSTSTIGTLTLSAIDGYTLPTPAAPTVGVLQTSGSALTWGTVNLASSSYVTGVLPTGNQAAQSITGITGDITFTGTTASGTGTVVALDGYALATPFNLGSAQDGYVLTWHNATSKWTPLASSGGGGVSLAGDLGNTSSVPYVESISGTSPINITPATLRWVASTSSPTFTQAQAASGSGTTFTIAAQAGASGSNGGALNLNGGAGTTGGTVGIYGGNGTSGNFGSVVLGVAGTTIISLLGSNNIDTSNTLQWAAGTTGANAIIPIINQAQAASGNNGNTFTIAAQAGASNTSGGSLNLNSGAATGTGTAAGNVNIAPGSTGSSGTAGMVSITGGTGTATGGNVNITGGGGTATGGTVGIYAGNGTSTIYGNVVLGMNGTAIVSLLGAGTSATSSNLQWAAGITAPLINQATTSGTAQTFSIAAQSTTGGNVAGGNLSLSAGNSNNGASASGGNVLLSSGTATLAPAANSGNIQLQVGATTNLTLTSGTFQWATGITTPLINQASTSGTAQTFSIAAQSNTGSPGVGGNLSLSAGNANTGSASTGGNLILSSGSATSNTTSTAGAGNVNIQTGGHTIYQFAPWYGYNSTTNAATILIKTAAAVATTSTTATPIYTYTSVTAINSTCFNMIINWTCRLDTTVAGMAGGLIIQGGYISSGGTISVGTMNNTIVTAGTNPAGATPITITASGATLTVSVVAGSTSNTFWQMSIEINQI